MSHTDRNPSDQILTSQAVCAWLRTDDGDQIASIRLLAILVEQGVLTPDEAADADVCEPEDDPRADIFVQGGALCVSVEQDGTVFTTDCR